MKICAFVGDMYRDYSAAIILSLQKKAIENGHSIDVFGNCSVPAESSLHSDGLKSILALPKLENYDGIIVCSDTLNHAGLDKDIMERLIAYPSLPPTVSIRVDEPTFFSIVPDNRKIMHDIAEYVIQKCGCDDIGFVTGRDDLTDSAERLNGFKDAMEEAGYKTREEMIFHGNYWTNQGPQTADFFTKADGTLPKAIICSNDYMAIALMDELKERGYVIPRDVMITGIDNLDAAAVHIPSLTTSDIPEETLAFAAMDCLEKLVAGEKLEKTVMVPGRVIKRESTNDRLMANDYDGMQKIIDAIQRNYYDRTRFFVLMNAAYDDVLSYDACTETTLKNLKDLQFCKECYLVKHQEIDRKLAGFFTDEKESICNLTFPLEDLLPESHNIDQTGVRVFLPIFYKNETYGYAAFVLDPESKNFIDERLEFVMVMLGQMINRLRLYDKMVEVNNIMDLYVKDSLTGLYNRRGFEKGISAFFNGQELKDKKIAVVSIDMDGLKWINDNLGHSAGDEALKGIAYCITSSINEGEIAARMGGDEFEVVLILDNPARIGQFTRKFRSAVNEANEKNNVEYTLSASIGTCEVSDWDSLMECMNKADKIMYIEKKSKKHRD